MSANLGMRGGTCKICKLNFVNIGPILRVLLLAGTSSEEDASTRRFREYLHVTSRLSGVFFGTGYGVFSSFFVLARSAILNDLFLLLHIPKFPTKLCCWVPDVTSSPGRSFSFNLEKQEWMFTSWFPSSGILFHQLSTSGNQKKVLPKKKMSLNFLV